MKNSLTDWDLICSEKRLYELWDFIYQLEKADVNELNSLQDSVFKSYAFILFFLQTKQFLRAENELLNQIPQSETAWLYNFCVILLNLLKSDTKLRISSSDLRFDKGYLFSTYIAAANVYPGLVDAIFSTPSNNDILLESAYKVSSYPWLHSAVIESEETKAFLSSTSHQSIQALLLFLSDQFTPALALLKTFSKEDSAHWVWHWLTAKAAYETGDSSVSMEKCALLQQIKPQFWYSRELQKHVSGWFAQIAQDDEIEKYLITFRPKEKTCIEIGAFDGVHYSNVRRLVTKFGWKSIHVEPVHDNFLRLKKSYSAYPEAILVNKAISPDKGPIPIHVSSYPNLQEWGSDVASVLEAEKDRWDKLKPDWHTENVETITLTDLAESAEFSHIDVLSIDAEGYDLEVLKTLDFNRFKPELIIIEYGNLRDEIIEFAHTVSYSVYEDNGQDLFLAPTENVPLSAIQHLINPHFLKVHSAPESLQLLRVKSSRLLTPERFDLPFKINYAQHFYAGDLTNFATEAYKAHLKVFNNFFEEDGSGKSDFESFQTAFHEVLTSFQTIGFNPAESVIPVSSQGIVLDGAHRVAAAFANSIPVLTVVMPNSQTNFNSTFFAQKNLEEKWLDFGASLFAELDSTTRAITLFPRAEGLDSEIDQFIRSNVPVIYFKSITPYGKFGINLIRQIYADEPWLGSFKNGFSGAEFKASNCFSGSANVRVYLIQSDNLVLLKTIKEKIRAAYNVENHSVHINDTHGETALISGALLNANSRHFLEKSTVQNFPVFYTLFNQFSQWLNTVKVPLSNVCIDGSSSLSAYGIRECGDLDFLHVGDKPWAGPIEGINSHVIASQLKYHGWPKDEIIQNPELHFYLNGVKCISLQALNAMKTNRGEGKDIEDCKAIQNVLNTKLQNVRLEDFRFKSAKSGKIIGLVPVKNEELHIENSLRALSLLTDGIIVLDDHSDDNTVNIVKSLAKDCCILEVIEKDTWFRDEPGDRNLLLNAGRNHGGTHFIVLDADELFTGNCLENNLLKHAIYCMNPGDQFFFTWIQLWRSCSKFRFDNSVWTWNMKAFIFCDDGECYYESEFIHTGRTPANLDGTYYFFKTYDYGLMHFQFVNWHNLLVKQAWYRMLELIRQPHISTTEINIKYYPSKNESGLALQNSPYLWFEAYSDWFNPSKLAIQETWRTAQIHEWFEKYGVEYFKKLDIWDIDWNREKPADFFTFNEHEIWKSGSKEANQLVGKREFNEAIRLLSYFISTSYRQTVKIMIEKIQEFKKSIEKI